MYCGQAGRLKRGQAGLEIRSFGLNDELIQALLAGRIDATLQDTIEISEALLKQPRGADFSFTGPVVVDPSLGSGVALGVRKEDQLLRQRLNAALAAIRADGTYQAIVDRYIGK